MADYPRWDTATGAVKCAACRTPVLPGTDIFIKAKGVYYCGSCGPAAEAAGASVLDGGIEEALICDLEELSGEVADTVLAKQALYMARQLDLREVGPREVTQYTKEIRLNLLQLRDLHPPETEDDDTEARRERLTERRRREQGGI